MRSALTNPPSTAVQLCKTRDRPLRLKKVNVVNDSNSMAPDASNAVFEQQQQQQQQQQYADTSPLLQISNRAAPALALQGDSHSAYLQLKVLSVVNDSTKWVVSAVVTAVLLWQHNAAAAWCVVGAVFSSFLCKVMKHIINQQRPENARKADPGMPSSHANSLNFLSVYAAMSLHHYCSSQAAASALALSTLGLGVFLTWLRVALGYHTWAQVLVGAALGAATAAGWFELGVTKALPALQGSATATTALYAATGLAMAAFGVKNVLSWAEERRHHQHNSKMRQHHHHQQQQQQEEQQEERELMRGLHNSEKPQQWQQVWGHQEGALPVETADEQSKDSIAPAAVWAG